MSLKATRLNEEASFYEQDNDITLLRKWKFKLSDQAFGVFFDRVRVLKSFKLTVICQKE